MSNGFKYSLDDIANTAKNNPPQEERLKIQKKLKKNNNLARTLLVLSKISPCGAAYLAKTMTNTFKTDYPKNSVYYLLNILCSNNLVSVIKIGNIDMIEDKVAEQIKERHKKFLKKIPVAFRNNYDYKSNMKYYWVTVFGETFLEFCYTHILNGNKKDGTDKTN